MTFSHIEAALTGERMLKLYTGGHERPSQGEIARLAYDFYEARRLIVRRQFTASPGRGVFPVSNRRVADQSARNVRSGSILEARRAGP